MLDVTHGVSTGLKGWQWLSGGAALLLLTACSHSSGSGNPSIPTPSAIVPALIGSPPLNVPPGDGSPLGEEARRIRLEQEFLNQPGLAAIGAHWALARGATGAGVLVGQIDSGVDHTHPEMRRQGFDPRTILTYDVLPSQVPNPGAPGRVVDVDAFARDIDVVDSYAGCTPSSGPSPCYVQRIFDREGPFPVIVDASRVPSQEEVAHGTYSAGIIAATRGNGITGIHGIAPESELLVVSLGLATPARSSPPSHLTNSLRMIPP